MADVILNPQKVRPLFGSETITRIVGEDSRIGRTVIAGTDERVYQTDARDNNLLTGWVGMIVGCQTADKDGNLSAGAAVDVLWFGRVAPGVALDPTKQYYFSDTPGLLCDDAAGATHTRRAGKPESAAVFFFNPQDVATSYSS